MATAGDHTRQSLTPLSKGESLQQFNRPVLLAVAFGLPAGRLGILLFRARPQGPPYVNPAGTKVRPVKTMIALTVKRDDITIVIVILPILMNVAHK